jgi:lysyl-tRNA synthetase class 1
MKHKDFDPSMPFLDFIEQYDRVERIYYGMEEAASEKEAKKLKKIYEISQIKISESMPFQPSYRFLTVAYQIAGDDEGRVFNILKTNSQLPVEMESKNLNDLDQNDIDGFRMRLNHVKNWLNKYAPSFVKFEVQKEIPKVELSKAQDEFLFKVSDALEKNNYTPETFHDEMYLILNDLNLKPQKAFQAIYKMIIGKKQGPRAASFVLSLDKDFVIKRFRKQA